MKLILTFALLVFSVAAFAAAPIEADLLASYAPSYASSVGGEDNAQVLLANAVIGNNVVNDQSGTGAHMRIAGFFQSTNDVINQTTTGGIVNWLSGNDAHLSDVVAYGSTIGADVVVYVCQNSDSASIAGVSQQPGYYSALNPGAVWYVVFAHETGGHAYGRSHSDGVLNPKTIMLHNYCGGGAAPPYFFSNPNIWFNGVQLIGDANNNCSMGSLINGGDNSSVSAQSVADRRTRVVTAPNLNNVVLRWSFTNAPGSAPASTTNYDLVASAPAVVRGIGATYTGRALRIPGGTTGNTAANSLTAYIDLPNGIISSRTNITIEIWATPLSAPNWARVFDFGRTVEAGNGAAGEWTGAPGTAAPGTTSSSDDIMLSVDVGTDITQQRFEAKLNGFATTLDSGLATAAGVQHHYAITFADGLGAAGAAGGRWQWYRDGDAIAFLDVTNHLAEIEDVNNWLGRSMWSGDNMANNDYAEVRISNVTLSRNEIVANYLLGPNYFPTVVTLTNSDASGASSFNAAGQWNSATTPASANSYEIFDFQLRTPATSSAYQFGGNALKISGGSLWWSGTASSTVTVSNLVLNSGSVRNAGAGTATLAGTLSATTNGGTFSGVNGAFTINAGITGNGPLTFLANNATLAGTNNSFTGKVFIGNGMAGALTIDSQARLGTNPVTFNADQLTLNRGTLTTTASFALNDTNRGILLDVSGGTFNVGAGTILSVSNTLSSPVMASGVIAGSLTKTGSGTLLLNSASNTFKGTLYVDSGSTTANDGAVKITSRQVLTNAHSPIYFRNNNTGSSEFQLDGTSGNIILPQAVSLAGRTAGSTSIRNVAGTNTIAGGLTINAGGSIYYLQSDAGQLNLGGTISSVATGARTITFYGTGNFNITGVIANGGATLSIAKYNSGVLTLGGTNLFSGTTTVNSGTLLVNGSISNGTVILGNGATLGGNGKIFGAVTVQSGTTLAPGTSAIGRLTISNSLIFTSGSTNFIRISKNGGARTNDSVTGTSLLYLDGTLIVTNVGPTALAAGDTFKIFSVPSSSGNFATANLPTVPATLAWTNKLAVDGTLAVVNVISATPTNLDFSISGTTLFLSWPADHTGWRLQVQTNNLTNGFGTNWSDVAGSTSVNVVGQTLDATIGSIFYRLIYP